MTAIASGWAETALGRDFRVTMLPNGSRFGCANCHVSSFGGGTRTAFGQAVFSIVGSSGAAIPFWSPTLASQDSDGDGFSNGRELGDPEGDGTPAAGAQITNPGQASSRPQNTAPSVQLTSPGPGAGIVQPASIEWAATANDTDGTIAKVDFLLDGAVVFTDTEAPYSHTLPSQGIAPGEHTLSVRATDNAGGTGNSAPITITVSAPAKVPPEASIARPASGAEFVTTAGIEIEASASDNDGTIALVEFLIDGASIASVTVPPFVHTIAPGQLAQGSHTITVRATDDDGAATVSAPVNITIVAPPNVPPLAAVLRPTPAAEFLTTAAFEIEASASDSDGTIASVEFLVGGVSISSITAPPFVHAVQAGQLALGPHTVTVSATDDDGATTVSEPVEIMVKAPPANVPPLVTLVQPTNGARFARSAPIEIRVEASDPDDGLDRVELHIGAALVAVMTNAPYAHTIEANFLQPGIHVLFARAADKAGAATDSDFVELSIDDPSHSPVTVSGIARSAEGFLIRWTGGTGPFSIRRSSAVDGTGWTSAGETAERQFAVPAAEPAAFYVITDLGNSSPE